MSTASLRRYTAEEYLALERLGDQKHEFYRGELFAMAGASNRHNIAQINLIAWVHGRLRAKPCLVYGSDMRVRVDATGLYTYPDLSVTCGEPEFLDGHADTLLNPRVIVEVLSDSTETYDRGKKFDHYRQIPALGEYLLVSQNEPRIDRYSLLDDGRWALEVAEGLQATMRIDVADASLPLAEVYRRIEFTTAE